MATARETSGAIYLITGPMAAGKSSVAELLARRFARGVHLEGDVFRRSIISGREEMSPDPLAEAIEQLRLRYRLAAAAADVYHAAGFTVALEDVVGGAFLRDYIALIQSRPLHVIVLVPSLKALTARRSRESRRVICAGRSLSTASGPSPRRHASACGSTARSRLPRRRWTRSCAEPPSRAGAAALIPDTTSPGREAPVPDR